MSSYGSDSPQPSDALTRFDVKSTDEDLKVLPAGRLERMTGKAPSSWTDDDLIEIVRDRRIRLISLMHIGGDGWLKTLDFVPRDFSHLRDILIAGERADGSSLFTAQGIQPGASDVVLRPRVSTAFLDPFALEPTLVLLCGHYGRDGKPLPESPDTIVRNAYNRVKKETGVDLQALGEVEYFLGKRPDEGDIYGSSDRGYHAPSPFVFGEKLRREALALLAQIGVPIKYGHSEVGYIEASEQDPYIWEQHEVELALWPLPQAAEAVVLAQWVIRNLAHRYGMRCSFDPIVRRGHAGSGMHFHMSPNRDGAYRGGKDENGELYPEAKWLISGLTTIGGALMAFGNRDEGSFIRLTQGKEAPNTVTWGSFNRKALIRLPIVPMDDKGNPVTAPTVEFRLPDGSAHPHLLLAGIAQAMLVGRDDKDLENHLKQTSMDNTGKTTGAAASVPRTFEEVAAAVREHRDSFQSGDVFPEHVMERVIDNLNS